LKLLLLSDPSQISAAGWSSFINAHPDGTVFQSPDMYELFDRTEKMCPVVIGVVNEDAGTLAGVLLGVIIREMNGIGGYFSSRTVVYGGPLVAGDAENPEAVTDLLLQRLIDEVKNRSIFIQFRNFRDMEAEKEVFKKYRFHYRERLNYIVDTSSEARVKERMGPEKLRQLRKGLRNGATITRPASEVEMREFFNILDNLYKFKVKKPLPEWSFFREFYRLSKEERLGVVRLVKKDGKVIGGILCPVSPGRTIYEWYVGGLDHEYKNAYPSVLATWAVIDHALNNGITAFDFMGVGIPGRSYGVRTFKSRFGGEMVNYGRYARINNRTFYFVSEMGYNVLMALKKLLRRY